MFIYYICYIVYMKKKLGLALAGGAAAGLCHIGVLKVFEDNEIYINSISGVSFGALIGGLYCSGYSAYKIEDIAKQTDWQRLLDFTLPINSFIRGRKIENKIRDLVKNKQFNELSPRLVITATNLDSGSEVVFRDGDLTSAIRASIAIPGIIAPKRINKQRFCDGALVDPTGVLGLKGKYDVLVAVDLSAPFETSIKLIKSKITKENELIGAIGNNIVGNFLKLVKKNIREKKFKKLPRLLGNTVETIFDRLFTPSRLMNFFSGSISPQMVDIVLRANQIVTNRLYNLNFEIVKPDIIIKPKRSYLGWVDFENVDEFVAAGERAAKKALPRIKKLLK